MLGARGRARFPSRPDRAEDGAGDKIQGDVLFGGQRGIHDAGAPARAQKADNRALTHSPEDPIEPDRRKNGERHVEGRAGVADAVDALQKRDGRILRPVDVRLSDRSWKAGEDAETCDGKRPRGDSVGDQFFALVQKKRRQRDVDPQREIEWQCFRAECDQMVEPSCRHGGYGKQWRPERPEIGGEEDPDESQSPDRL